LALRDSVKSNYVERNSQFLKRFANQLIRPHALADLFLMKQGRYNQCKNLRHKF
jgi:hypothetical protein